MASDTFTRLASAATQEYVLRELKDFKNALIGNTWRKVEAAEDEALVQFLLGLIAIPAPSSSQVDDVQLDIINETVVIFAALANVGPLTLRPLLEAEVPAHLLALINSINHLSVSSSSLGPAPITRLLAPLLRALRNILVSTTDTVWGQSWGVGLEKKVVETGLMNREEGSGDIEKPNRKGKSAAGKKAGWDEMVRRTVPLIFEPDNLDSLLSLIYLDGDPQILMPLYQLLARLIALPYHRKLLASWSPPQYILENRNTPQHLSAPTAGSSSSRPVILEHLISTITASSLSSLASRKPNAKLLESALDLVAGIVKGQSALANLVRTWQSTDQSDVMSMSVDFSESGKTDKDRPMSEFMGTLSDLLTSTFTNVRIAAASCLTNIVKADKGSKTAERVRSTVMNLQILVGIISLLRSEGMEEKVKLCFILAALVSDDGNLQKSAADQGCPALVMQLFFAVDKGLDRGDFGMDVASRSKEAALLALAALAFQHEPTRALIDESSPPFLPQIHKSLSHPSYGVRAAACQLTRALSRTVAILRTSLVDSGVGEEMILTLRREVEYTNGTIKGRLDGMVREEDRRDEDLLDGQEYTVEVAATATLCNLIADFSPLKATLLRDGGLELICALTHSTWQPLALNALWALKNLVFHALEALKTQVMSVLTCDALRDFIGPSTPLALRVQAMEILQNLLADAPSAEITKMLEKLGEEDLVVILQEASGPKSDIELRVPALYVLSNLALGNEKARGVITSRPEILNLLSEALNAKDNTVKVPALRCLRHLVESNSKSRRPRQAIVDLLSPYGLKGRLKNLADYNPSLDVCHAATSLLEVLDKSKESAVSPSGTPTRAIDVR